MAQQRYYPIGIQTFSEIRKENYMYVDKTGYVYQMTHNGLKYVFLSRPRRFGKSLLVSTLHSYFNADKELFSGLEMERLETEWTRYPVLHFDMSQGKDYDKDSLQRYLNYQLYLNERRLGLKSATEDINIRLNDLIHNAYEQAGQKVVVLIDEYDSPLLDVLHEDERLPQLRQVMTNFYSPLKAAEPYLRFCFLTGITKFSQLSIFSALNNIKNVSMDEDMAAVCGITKEEVRTQLWSDVESLAARMGISPDEAFDKLVDYYDGYHFTWPSPDLFNPYSLINAFHDGKVKPYWFETGTPTALIQLLRKAKVTGGTTRVEAIKRKVADFDRPTEQLTSDAAPLLYQSGYLTIKDYSRVSDNYTLDIPNKEVRIGLSKSQLGAYVKNPAEVNFIAGDMSERICLGDMDGALRLMQNTFATLPYCTRARSEGHFQQLLALTFTLVGSGYVDVEVRTPVGRVDVVLRTSTTLYLIELKLNCSADVAMRQIDLRDYPSRFALCGLPIVKVGINFDRAKKNITDWSIQPAE